MLKTALLQTKVVLILCSNYCKEETYNNTTKSSKWIFLFFHCLWTLLDQPWKVAIKHFFQRQRLKQRANSLHFCSRHTLIEAETKCEIEGEKKNCTKLCLGPINRELNKLSTEGIRGASILKIRRKMAIKINMHLILIIESIVISKL